MVQSPHEVFTLLSVKHFEDAVDFCTRLPIPRGYQAFSSDILLLRNSEFPRHFLNGCYVFLKRGVTEDDIRALLSSLAPTPDQPLLERLLSRPFFHGKTLQPVVRFRVLGVPAYLDRLPQSWRSEGSTSVMSIRPSPRARFCAGWRSYLCQLRHNAYIVEGDAYFTAKYPAKKHQVKNEIVLAWVCGHGKTPAAYIQYRVLGDERTPHALVTGIAVEEPFRRRGYGRALLLAVIAGLPQQTELWVEVRDENEPAKSMYRSCGFVERWRQQSFLSLSFV